MSLVALSRAEPRIDYPRDAEPQRRLMVAVLQTVLDDYRDSMSWQAAGQHPAADLRDIRQAMAYVASTDRVWPFSFENICEALGLNASSLRQELQKGPTA